MGRRPRGRKCANARRRENHMCIIVMERALATFAAISRFRPVKIGALVTIFDLTVARRTRFIAALGGGKSQEQWEAFMLAYTVTTLNCRDGSDPYRVVVLDGCDHSVVEMSALSLPHARKVAEALALLLPKLQPDHAVVLSQARARGGPEPAHC